MLFISPRTRNRLLTVPLPSLSSFFRYCHVNLSRYPQKERPEDLLTVPTTRLVTRAGLGGGAGNKHPGASTDEEVELISEYSWRNFFSAINRTKIIQKLLKGRSEKIYQFNQHKPFVRTSFLSGHRHLCRCLADNVLFATIGCAEHVQADAQGCPPDVPAPSAQDHQESDPSLRKEVEAASVLPRTKFDRERAPADPLFLLSRPSRLQKT